ncbi:MAG TPA: hopanoid biosynthesis-associated protein HpnK [Verrucomicrobiota bacterium]|nr:hopanoid biosynthesis-associated protein HpnK [Verrucomicrobiota bacterium]
MNADDFGRSDAINQAVIRAHCEGILTSASLMVNEPACAQAARLAQAHPRLGVGLHLTLVSGRAALTPQQAPGLVSPEQAFAHDAIRAGLLYFFKHSLREVLRQEIAAQFARFAETGLVLDHVNGHLNMHLHPTVLRLLCAPAGAWTIPSVRLTRDSLWVSARLARGHWIYRLSHALIFSLLCAWARPRLRRARMRHTRAVFGLLQNGRVDTEYVSRLLERLPEGDSELYCHPSLTDFRHELDALVSAQAREAVRRSGIQLIRYQDLDHGETVDHSADRPRLRGHRRRAPQPGTQTDRSAEPRHST